MGMTGSDVSGDRLPRRTGALWILEHWPRGPLRGSYHLSQGGLSSLKVLTACPCPSSRRPRCLLSCPHSHLQSLICCRHASEAQEQVPCPREMPPGLGGHSGGPGQCCCSPKGGAPLLPLFCPSGGLTPLSPPSELPEIPVATREQSGVLCFHSR